MKRIIALFAAILICAPVCAQSQKVSFELYSPTLKSLKVELSRPVIVKVNDKVQKVYFLPDTVYVDLPEGKYEYSIGRDSGQGTVYWQDEGRVDVANSPQRVSVGIEL